MNEKDMINRISIVNVKNKLELQEVYSSGDTIYVRCPFCCSKKGDMKLNISNNSYVCKNCDEKGFSVGLYANYKYISNKEAYKRLISQEADMQNNCEIIINSIRKNDEELDEVYQAFLKMLKLSSQHTVKLLELGFSLEDIATIGYKTIPIQEMEKIELCNRLIEKGYELEGVPGYYQNSSFKWTFVSHNGFFIPIIKNKKVVGLRIHLDKEYDNDTTDIWFSSGKKYNGTKIENINIILFSTNNILRLVNGKEQPKDIIIASEMLLAYKLFYKYKNAVIVGVPNVVTKKGLKELDVIENVDNVYVVLEKHTILHSTNSVLVNLDKRYGSKKVKLSFSIKEYEIPEEIEKVFGSQERLIQNIA